MPVVESLLSAAKIGLGFTRPLVSCERFSLQPAGSLVQVIGPQVCYRAFGGSNPHGESCGKAAGAARLFHAGNAIGNLSAHCALSYQAAAGSLSLVRRAQCEFQLRQFPDRQLQNSTTLILFQLTNACNALDLLGRSHRLYLLRQRRQTGEAIGKTDMLVRVLDHELAHRAAGCECSIELRVDAGFVCANTNQIF